MQGSSLGSACGEQDLTSRSHFINAFRPSFFVLESSGTTLPDQLSQNVLYIQEIADSTVCWQPPADMQIYLSAKIDADAPPVSKGIKQEVTSQYLSLEVLVSIAALYDITNRY